MRSPAIVSLVTVVTVVTVIAVLAVHATAVRAQTPGPEQTEAEAAFADGKAAFDRRDYTDASNYFLIAFNKDPNPLYLFNAAQGFRLGGDCVEAYRRYKQFLDIVKGKNVTGTEKVEQYVHDLTECAQSSVQAPTGGGAQAPALPPVTPPPAPPAAPSNALAYALTIGGGVVFGLAGLAQVEMDHIHYEADMTVDNCDHRTTCAGTIAGFNSNGHVWSDLAVSGYIAGGAAVVAGVALLYVDYSRSSEHVVVVAPTPGGATAVASWRF